MFEIRKTKTFAKWLDGLRDMRARARVQVRIERLGTGNAGDAKSVGGKAFLRCESTMAPAIVCISQSVAVRSLCCWPAAISGHRMPTSEQPCGWHGAYRSAS